MKHFPLPREFVTTLGAICDEYGITIDEARAGGLVPFRESDRDYPISLYRDSDGDWHVRSYGDLLDDGWAPSPAQAVSLYAQSLL
jgi:hypothetical protein